MCASKTLFRSLRRLNVANCLIESDGAASIGQVLRDSKIVSLDLRGNKIGSYGVGSLSSRGIEGNVSLEELILDSNGIDDAGAIELANGLGVHGSLQELSLYDNLIGPPGGKALTTALSNGTLMLKKLNLGKNMIHKDGLTKNKDDKEGVVPMAPFLTKNSTLISLDISENSLGGTKLDAVLILAAGYDGVVSLMDSLKVNRTLLSVNLAGNRMGKVGMRAVSDAIGGNKCLSRVLFDALDHIELVEAGIKQSHTLTEVGCEMVGSVASSIARNRKERDGFFQGLQSGLALAKVKAFVDKGVDIFCDDVMTLVRKTPPEIISYFHTVPHIRNFMFSSVALLDGLKTLPPGSLKAFAKEKGPVTCLLFAARSGHSEAVRLMLQNGADPNQKDAMTRAPLHLATEHGHLDVVTVLLDKGANPKEMLFRLPLLLLAVKNGHAELAKYLLERYPDMRTAYSPAPKVRTALHVAAKSGRARVVRMLLEKGFDPNVMSGDELTPIDVAASPEICRALMDAGARSDPTSLGRALQNAMSPEGRPNTPNLDVVTFLLENNADRKEAFAGVRDLDLRNLYRDTLPVWIGQLPNLQSAQLVQNNSLQFIPENVRLGGDVAVLEYLRDIAQGRKDVWQRFKIMCLGKEGSGKTHIYHLCAGTNYPRNKSTDGIDIDEVMELGPDRVPVTWFDFGGQEVFYPTHELFLTGQCVYLIVFKMDDPEYDKRVQYWLKVVSTFALDRAKVVVVGTHRDRLANGDADVAKITRRIHEITASSTTVVEKLYISCVDDPVQTSEQIVNALMAAAHQAKLGGKEVPHIYTVIKKWADDQKKREKSRPYFLWDAFVECFPGYDSYLLERACEFLHDMGAIFLAKRFVGNKKANLVCIDIRWIATAFSAIVTFRHNWVKEGVLRQEALVHIWRDFGLVDMQDMLAIMSLFEKFNIAFARREDGAWIIPSMLSETTPDSALQLPEGLTHARMYRLSVVPSGAFGQVLARMSEWSDVKIVAMWRFGIVLRDATDIAALTVEGSEISLRVFKAPRMRPADTEKLSPAKEGVGSLLRRLDEELQQIFKLVFRRMNDVPLEVSILCPHCVAAGTEESECKWLRYDDIVKLVLAGEISFQCDRTEAPLELIGEDLTLGYVKAFSARDVRLEKEALARGGFGLIYRGVMRSGAKIVVKELIMDQGAEVALFADFQREVSLMAQLHHPNLVQMYGVMLSPLRMVLEYCGEGDLLGALRKGKVNDAALKLRIAIDIAKGMSFLHTLSPPLAHRDLRSPNVLLMSLKTASKEAVAKVADFGLTAAASSRMQQELLTWQWMAPEAFLGENYTETCDLYSFGVILWEIFNGTGEIPFESIASQEKNKKKQARDFMNDIIHKGLRPVCGEDFPEDVSALILRLWEKDATTRPSFLVCCEILQAVQSGTKRPEGFLKSLLNRERAKVAAPVNRDLPMLTVSVRAIPLAGQDEIGSCVVRPSVQGFRDTIWLGGAQGTVSVVDASGGLLFQKKRAHTGAVTALQSLVVDGSVWSGGTDGIVRRWEVTLSPLVVATPPLRSSGQARIVSSSGSSTNLAGGGNVASLPSGAAQRNSNNTLPAANAGKASIGRTGGATAVQAGRRTTPPEPAAVGSPGTRPRPTAPGAGTAPSRNSVPSAAAASGGASLMSSASAVGQPPSTEVMEERRPEFVVSQFPDQPHKGAEIRAMLALDKTGLMVVGDSNGVVTVWRADGEVVFKTKLPNAINAICSELDRKQIWISQGQSLHRLEISSRGALRIAHSFKSTHEGGFLGMALAGEVLWVSDGPDIKLIDTANDAVVRIMQLPTAEKITCVSCVSAFGQPTMWCGSPGQVSMWDIKTRASIRSYVDLQGEVAFIHEVAENLVLVSYGPKLYFFDLHTGH